MSRYNFQDRQNVINYIQNMKYKDLLEFYSYYFERGSAGRGSKREFLVDLAKSSDIKEVTEKLFRYINYKAPAYIYHFTNKQKFEQIQKDNKIKVNYEKLICCTDKEDFMYFNTNPNNVRITIDTRLISNPFILIRRRDPDDENYVKFESEWCIDFTNTNITGIRLDDLCIKAIDYSPASDYANKKQESKLSNKEKLVDATIKLLTENKTI